MPVRLRDCLIRRKDITLSFKPSPIGAYFICVIISPAEVRKLSIKNQNKIENENNRIKLIKLPYKILRDYKNLLLTYNLKEYSYTVRSAIEYINFNLQNNLSLSIISSYIGKNASFLSNQFKKETGVTITRYIQEKRVEESIRMLYSSDLSIQEIAHSVGIDDLKRSYKVSDRNIFLATIKKKN